MITTDLRHIGVVSGAKFAHTSGTIALGSGYRGLNFQATFETTPGDLVAVKPVTANTGTCSKASCAKMLGHLDVYEARFGQTVSDNRWMAYRIYTAGTAGTCGANDVYVIEKLG